MRAPTLVVASFVPSALPLHAHEDEQAAACAVYAVLLAARAEGLASYWRTPGVLRSRRGSRGRRSPFRTTSASSACCTSARRTRCRTRPDAALEHFVTFLD